MVGELAGVLESLAALRIPEEILALRPSPKLQERIERLLELSRTKGFTPNEQRQWEGYEFVEHVVRMAKINARRTLKAPSQGPAQN